MEFSQIDIRTLLPQRDPFVMVGRLLHFDMDRTVTSTVFGPESIMVDDGTVSAAGVIENIAQTCAARIGYINTYILKKGIQIGYIGAIKGLTVNRLPLVGEELVTEISTLQEIFGMTLVRASVRVGDEVVAEGEMKIAVSEVESTNQRQ